MTINAETKIIGRFHTKKSPRGLNIYNPFFQEAGINAIYILFSNLDPKPLVDGLRNLNLFGAITAGFESNLVLPTLLDELEDNAKYVGKVGFVTNNNGILKGYSQGGKGLLNAILSKTDLSEKQVAIIGAGTVAKSLIYQLSHLSSPPREILIFNRTIDRAQDIVKGLNIKSSARHLDQLSNTKGDILVNATDLGGSEVDNLFTQDIVNNFQTIVDVTFQVENTNLINLAKKLSKNHVTGWDFFTHQAGVILETMFATPIDLNLLNKHVKQGLSQEVV
jgi:shikimate 5-dehydrogenase